MSTWLLTGGAGYIGSHIVRSLRSSGHRVVVLDDLSTGIAHNIPSDVTFAEANILQQDVVADALDTNHVDGVIHLAAKKAAGDSVFDPLHYYEQNVEGMRRLLAAMVDTGVQRLVFSSSAATYGETQVPFLNEETPTVPTNPYGETKLIGEWMAKDLARIGKLQLISLRYFNVAGAGSPELGDTSVANLIPMVFRALSKGERPQVFGADYNTRDGSCIRDYIHVADLADAHVAAVSHLDAQPADAIVSQLYNVGTGMGATVLEVMEQVRTATGIEFEPDVVARRLGDPAQVVADPAAIRRDLGWSAQHDLADMVASAWASWRHHHP
jgi:UDP-glucose 4-epimerase